LGAWGAGFERDRTSAHVPCPSSSTSTGHAAAPSDCPDEVARAMSPEPPPSVFPPPASVPLLPWRVLVTFLSMENISPFVAHTGLSQSLPPPPLTLLPAAAPDAPSPVVAVDIRTDLWASLGAWPGLLASFFLCFVKAWQSSNPEFMSTVDGADVCVC